MSAHGETDGGTEPKGRGKIRILVADDHEVVCIGLTSLLRLHPGFEVVGYATTGPEAVARAKELKPDVVIMDVRMPGGGPAACRLILEHDPHVRVMMLTSYDDDESVFSSIQAGASGYLLKEIDTTTLVRGVEVIARGGSLFDPAVADRVLLRMKPKTGAASAPETLTDREHEILHLLGQGLSNRQIARTIHLSENTVKNYVSSILNKLQLSNRTAAALYARTHHHEA